jgi:LAS superfamily LD-carboxypeptidase LdcB
MKDYKRLNERDKNKIKFYKKSKKFAKKSAKWWAIFSCIAFLFLIGVAALYKLIDNDRTSKLLDFPEARSAVSSSGATDTDGLNELNKKELERESEKSKNIVTNEGKEDDSVFKSHGEKVYDFSQWNKSCAKEMIIVNKNNPVSADVRPKTKSCRGKEVAVEACEDLENMITDARKAGVTIWISSAYRNIDLQTRYFKRRMEVEKSKAVISEEEAEKRAGEVVARPGTSEHHTGLAIDFNGVGDDIYKTKEYKWLMDNAQNYGFIERYQKKWRDYTSVIYEPWHFRYVGKENAPKIKESGMCLEEYVIKNLIKN